MDEYRAITETADDGIVKVTESPFCVYVTPVTVKFSNFQSGIGCAVIVTWTPGSSGQLGTCDGCGVKAGGSVFTYGHKLPIGAKFAVRL